MLDQKVKTLLATKKLVLLRRSIIKDSCDTDVLSVFDSIIQELQPSLIGSDKPNSNLTHWPSKKWFDLECQQSKQALLMAYKAFKRASGTDIHNLCIQLCAKKKSYKKLIREKKKAEQRALWDDLIQAARQKNSQMFWKLVSGKVTAAPVESYIPVHGWESFFHGLYEDPTCPELPPMEDTIPSWPPVSVQEIQSSIRQLRNGKAPGCDYIPPELLKYNDEFWSPLLASLFTRIDATGSIPHCWREAIVVPLFKKGNKDDPANYRPISLLSVISKVYAGHLLEKLNDWLIQTNFIVEEQAGFRTGRSTSDHVLVMKHLIDKYGICPSGSFYVAFVDLKSAFDSISRLKLWEKLESMNIDRRLLYLLRALHTKTSLRVRCSLKGHCTNSIPTAKGVKQGCVLAPTLFNMYINDLADFMRSNDFHPPTLAARKVSILLYADDTVILSRTPIGLRRALNKFSHYCSINQLSINYQKTKVMAFGRRPKVRAWSICGYKIEQVTSYKYLGVMLSSSGSCIPHHEYAAKKGLQSAQAIIKFLRTRGGNYIPAALKLYSAKVLPQLLYGSSVSSLLSCYNHLESVQSKFLRSAFQVASYASNSSLRLESGLIKVEAVVLLHSIFHWLKLQHTREGLAPLVLNDNFQSPWLRLILLKLGHLGFAPEHLASLSLDQAKEAVKQRIYDIERQNDVSLCPKFIASEDSKYQIKHSTFLFTLEIPSYRRAFFLARWDLFPSAILEGKLKGIPYSDRLCPCGTGAIESMDHVLLSCKFYSDIRRKLIRPLILSSPLGDYDLVRWLLAGTNDAITKSCASFLVAATKLRKAAMTEPN